MAMLNNQMVTDKWWLVDDVFERWENLASREDTWIVHGFLLSMADYIMLYHPLLVLCSW